MRRKLYAVEFIDGCVVFVTDPRHTKHEEAKERRKVEEAAERVRREIEDAREGGYLIAWYSYVRRTDIETLLRAVE